MRFPLGSPTQVEGVAFGYSLGGRCLIGTYAVSQSHLAPFSNNAAPTLAGELAALLLSLRGCGDPYAYKRRSLSDRKQSARRVRHAGDEMGLGKSVQAIALAWLYRDSWPLLVIAPAAVWCGLGPCLCAALPYHAHSARALMFWLQR